MTRDTKTCTDIINPSASPPDKHSSEPSTWEHTHEKSSSSIPQSAASQSDNKSKHDPDYPSRLDKYHCCAGEHLLNSRRLHEPSEGKDTRSQSLCPSAKPGQPCRLHLPSFQLSLKHHSAAGYMQGSEMSAIPGPYMQSSICVDQCTAPGCQIHPSTSIPLFLQRIKAKGP